MTVRLTLIAACVAALAAAAPGTARAKDEPASQDSARQAMTHDADASAQAGTDMSYGGVPDTRGASGHRAGNTCWPRPACDIFFGQ